MKKIPILNKGYFSDPKIPFWVPVLMIVNVILFIIVMILSILEIETALANVLAGICLLGFIIGFTARLYYKSPYKTPGRNISVNFTVLVYDTFLVLSTLCFIRLTILLPVLLSSNNADIAKVINNDKSVFEKVGYQQFLLFSTDYLYSFAGIIVILFLVLRIPLNHLKKKFTPPKEQNSFGGVIQKENLYLVLLNNAINKWNYILATWFGLFTVFSTIAVLGLG